MTWQILHTAVVRPQVRDRWVRTCPDATPQSARAFSQARRRSTMHAGRRGLTRTAGKARDTLKAWGPLGAGTSCSGAPCSAKAHARRTQWAYFMHVTCRCTRMHCTSQRHSDSSGVFVTERLQLVARNRVGACELLMTNKRGQLNRDVERDTMVPCRA